MVGAGSALLFHNSKTEAVISKIPANGFRDFALKSVGGISALDALANAINFPAAYSWKSPNVERRYV